MRKTAILLMLVGFAVVYFTIPLFGIDILMDAVGYLLVWNAVRVLHKKEDTFGFAPTCALVLTAICALQVTTGGMVLAAMLVVRPLAEALLYWQLLRGFARLAAAEEKPQLRTICFVVMALCIFASLVQCGVMFVSYTLAWAIVGMEVLQWVAHIAVLGLLGWLVLQETRVEKKD